VVAAHIPDDADDGGEGERGGDDESAWHWRYL
jgi:hypothetical protein